MQTSSFDLRHLFSTSIPGRCTPAAILAVAALSMMMVTAQPSAQASPWTLPADEVVVSLDHTFQQATHEYLDDGTFQRYPLNGQFRAQSTFLSFRYGFTDRFDGGLSLQTSHVTFSSDPLVLQEFEAVPGPGDATDAILDFSSNEFGLGDLRLLGRYNLFSDIVWITTGTDVKFPTGYEEPQGTFFIDNDGNERIGGQATLGDGQIDITQSLLFGTVIQPIDTFVRLGTELTLRMDAPGHQGGADFRVGRKFGDTVILMGGASALLTLSEGDVIGETVISNAPSQPGNQYSGEDLEVRDLRLDRDAVDISAGVLLALGELELTADYSYTVWGRNTANTHAFSLGTIISLPDVTGGD